MSQPRFRPVGVPQRAGKVRTARLTDLPALGELSRLTNAHEDSDDPVRSLGLPVSASQVSVFTLFRLPLGAFRPHDLLYVYEEEGKLAGLLRCERENHRDDWTIVELDAIDHGEAGDIRFRLVQHLLRDGVRRGASRFHVACADTGGNVELFMQAGFARYGEERILYRAPGTPFPPPVDDRAAAEDGIRPTQPLDALQLNRLYRASTPAPVARLEGYRLADWERQGGHWRVPRSSLAPILRFADIEAYVEHREGPQGPELAAFVQLGVVKEDQPHYLKVLSVPGHDPSALISYGLSVIGERASATRVGRGAHGHDHGVVTAVRTYEAPLDRRMEEVDFESVAVVSLLLKETLVRVAEPALVPAIR